jgi:hypothetical protein
VEYNIQLNMRLDGQALQQLLRTLDTGPHGLMRGIIDNVINQCRMQEEEVAQKQAAASEAPPETVQP